VIAKQALYHLSHTLIPFLLYLFIFWIRAHSFCPGRASDHESSWGNRCVALHPACLLRWGLANFLPRLDLNLDPPDLYLLNSQDYRCEPPCLALHCLVLFLWCYLKAASSSSFILSTILVPFLLIYSLSC
jgi:hypothetical protein